MQIIRSYRICMACVSRRHDEDTKAHMSLVSVSDRESEVEKGDEDFDGNFLIRSDRTS